MTDIVERLRIPMIWPVRSWPSHIDAERKEAADEIDRLRTENEVLLNNDEVLKRHLAAAIDEIKLLRGDRS